jgi:uncharacterized protein (TIGR04255 family)
MATGHQPEDPTETDLAYRLVAVRRLLGCPIGSALVELPPVADQTELRRSDSPDFSNPPVVEVALSVSFEPLNGYTSAHTGLYWNRVRDQFERAEEHPPYKIPLENEVAEPTARGMNVEVLKHLEPRIWLVNSDETELIQIQKDGFFRNWRKRSEEPYPRYKNLRQRFEREFTDFAAFVNEIGLGRLKTLQCEVTYVNQILAGEGWQRLGEIHKVLASCSELSRADFLPDPEQASWTAKFAIRDGTDRFLGRLIVAAAPAFRRIDGHGLIQLTLTARGQRIGAGVEGVLGFFDIGHDWIVRGFADLTTPGMHDVWGRIA